MTSRLRFARQDVPKEIHTIRLRLVESDPAFAATFAQAMRDSYEAMRFIPSWRSAVDVDIAAKSLRTSIELADREVVRHAFVLGTGDYVGRLDLHSWDDEVPKCELGYFANAPLGGRGLMTEACQALLDVAWSMGVVRVQAICDGRNERAIRLAERLGMQREGVLRNNDRGGDGELTDDVILAVTRAGPAI